MNLLVVVSVASLALQATAARRIASTPGDVHEIEAGIRRVTLRAALGLGGVLVLAAPLRQRGPAAGEPADRRARRADRRTPDADGGPGRHPAGRAPLAPAGAALPRRRRAPPGRRHRPDPVAARGADRHRRRAHRRPGPGRRRLVGAARARPGATTTAPTPTTAAAALVRESLRNSQALLAFFAVSNVDIIVARNVLERPRLRPVRRRPDPHQGDAVPAAVRRRRGLPRHGRLRRPPPRPAAEPRRRRPSSAWSASRRRTCSRTSPWSSSAATTTPRSRTSSGSSPSSAPCCR